MKNLTKSFGFIVYFIVMQCLVSIGYVFYKMSFDTEWSDQVYTLVSTGKMFSKEYLTLVSQAVIPMLILADIILMIPMFIYAYKKHIKLYQKVSALNTLKLISLGLILNFIVTIVVDNLPKSLTTSQYDQLISMILTDSFLLTFLSSAILAPVIEELIFRFGICGLIYKDNEKKAIFISALMFGIAHFNLIQSTYAFILGLILAYVYVKSKNLLTSTILHITINGSSILYEYFNHTAVLVIGITIIMGTLIYCKKRRY